MKKLLWIVEDEKAAQFFYKKELGTTYDIKPFLTLSDLDKALSELIEGADGLLPDLLICDINLPDGSLLDFIVKSESIKALALPLLVVSANDDVNDINKAYAMSVVDYLVKPFNMNELSAKVNRFLIEKDRLNEIKDFLEIDVTAHSIKNKYGSIVLSTKPFQLVALLLKSPGRKASKEEIVKNVWHDVKVVGKNMEVQISRVRPKIAPLNINIVFESPNFYAIKPMREV